MNDNLQDLLEHQLTNLQSLYFIMEKECEFLNQHPTPTNQLQELLEKKRVLINIIENNEKKRFHIEQNFNIQEPYQENTVLHNLWCSIKKITVSLKNQNSQNNKILKCYMEFNHQQINLMRKYHSQSTYSANGLEKPDTLLGKNFSI
ncbi:flagella synthesis protein FlgN [Providencia sneebia]|uniref:FlgN family protein n=1 Tax=Providencia sneebia DSM 19967 TaxID=1141660 RepID=K8WD43_9GAMM|nr:FlgN family protein [Providencia sneebia DSM 19967]